MSNDRSYLAIAKAVLLRDALRHASQLQLSARAHAVLAHLVAEAWPRGSRWAVRISQQTLAHRLACSTDSIKRALAEIVPELVQQHNGRARTVSLFVIREVRTRAPSEGAPVHGAGRTRAPSEGAPVHPSTGNQYLFQEDRASTTTAPWWATAEGRERCRTLAQTALREPTPKRE